VFARERVSRYEIEFDTATSLRDTCGSQQDEWSDWFQATNVSFEMMIDMKLLSEVPIERRTTDMSGIPLLVYR